MDIASPKHNSNSIYLAIEEHLRFIRVLLVQLEPNDRNQYVSELIIRLLATRGRSPKSVQDTMNSKLSSNDVTLTEAQKLLIEKVSNQTEELYKALHNEDNY